MSELSDVDRVSYHFGRSGDVLLLERYFGESFVAGSVHSLRGAELDEVDYEVDTIVGASRGKPFNPELMGLALGALDGCDRVLFEGELVHTSGDTVLPLGVIRNLRKGVRLEVVKNPSISEIVGRGVALCGDTLQPLGHTEITGEKLENLPFGKSVDPSEYAELVTELLPQLEADIPIDIRTTRLPEVTTSAEPRIAFNVQQGATLKVLPTLVYGTPAIARIEGDKMVHLRGPAPIRDRVKERALLTKLRDTLNLVPGRRVEYDRSTATRVTEKLRAWRGEDDDFSAPGYVLSRALVPIFDFSSGFDITFESDDESGPPRRAAASAVIGAWQSGLELTPLEEGGWAPLPVKWLDEHGARVADLLAARDDDGTVPRFALPDLAALASELGEPPPPITETISELLEGFDGIRESELPEDFTGTLRHYQESGVNWLVCLRDAELGAVLADDMGLGKTVQALCALNGRSLVVCPTSVLPSWLDELRHFRPGLNASVFHGPGRTLDEDADVTLTTYALLRIDSKKLTAVEWDAVVLDESQMIKNPQSGVTRAAHKLQAKFRLALSGTPIENRLDELWSQFHFTNRGLLGTRPEFHKRYVRPIARDEPGVAEQLRQRIKPFLLRRIKEDVEPDLPERTEAILYCELDEEERALYERLRTTTLEEVVTKLRKGGSVIAALTTLLRLRQAACHRALVPNQRAKGSSKITALIDALERAIANGHKAVVFSQWTSFLDLVEPHLKKAKLGFTRLDGSTTNRGDVVAGFQADDGPPVMLASLKAGGTGLTLTAADHVFLLDPWWNPAVEDQAADRTHRIGQSRPVIVYRIVANQTVEARILALQEKKRAIANIALGEAGQATGLTREDLLALLE